MKFQTINYEGNKYELSIGKAFPSGIKFQVAKYKLCNGDDIMVETILYKIIQPRYSQKIVDNSDLLELFNLYKNDIRF